MRGQLFAIALDALVALARAPAVDIDVERPRIEALAESMAAAVEYADELAAWLPGAGTRTELVLPLPFTGLRAREATVLALAAIAKGESDLAADVADCRRGGPAWTTFQIEPPWGFGQYTKAKLCSSQSRAADRALWVLSFHADRCGTPAAAFRGYSSGDCSKPSRAAAAHCRRWERLSLAAGLTASCSRREVTDASR